MDFPGFDTLAIALILFVALREAGNLLRRLRAPQRDQDRGPLEA